MAANGITDPIAQRLMLAIAEGYRRLAERVEARKGQNLIRALVYLDHGAIAHSDKRTVQPAPKRRVIVDEEKDGARLTLVVCRPTR